MTIRVSVVVPTYRRPDLLERCLAALSEQDYPSRNFEVVVADAASDPATQVQVENWNRRKAHRKAGPHKGGPHICYVPVAGKNHGPAAARNAGWRAADGDIIAFTDDDCIPSTAWLRLGAQVFVDGIKGASGPVIIKLPDNPTDYERNAAGLAGIQFVTANCFYKRSELESVHGFDERFEMAWREDTDLFFTLIERYGNDEKFVHIQEAEVIHPIRPAKWGVSLQQQKKSMYNALLYKKHPGLYRQIIQPVPPWRYYRILLTILGASVSLLLGRKRFSLVFASLWLVMTGQFVAQRLKNTSRTPSHVAEMALTSAIIPPLSVFWRLVGAIRYRIFFL